MPSLQNQLCNIIMRSSMIDFAIRIGSERKILSNMIEKLVDKNSSCNQIRDSRSDFWDQFPRRVKEFGRLLWLKLLVLSLVLT